MCARISRRKSLNCKPVLITHCLLLALACSLAKIILEGLTAFLVVFNPLVQVRIRHMVAFAGPGSQRVGLLYCV
jgi:hypothetical protein